IACAKDLSKDQSYFLWQLSPTILDRVLFPLGDYTKAQVRDYLASKGFEALSKQGESQDICFIKGDYRAFLRERVGDNYKEYMSFTIGQRKGLGVALGYPAFVTKIGSRGVGVEHPLVPGVFLGHYEDLYTDTVTLRDVLFHGDPNQPVMAKIRYRSAAVEATFNSPLAQRASTTLNSKLYTLHFAAPIWAATPGQSCVFYQNNFVVGGGIIC
ncbi:MAG: tRNA 2-thiouridine(34) synthase MnmA, partial [Paludibacteraceae bacterium]|nr:tRNA 2-thiouridine(34) synthase MnmA [Paludibacteraceae bacterium]